MSRFPLAVHAPFVDTFFLPWFLDLPALLYALLIVVVSPIVTFLRAL